MSNTFAGSPSSAGVFYRALPTPLNSPATSPPTALDPDSKEIAPDGLPQAADFLFSRNGDLNQSVDVPISLTGTAPGSAYQLVDGYTGQIITGSVNFPAGFSKKVIEVIPINDGSAQWTRTVTVTEGTAANTQTSNTPATVDIEGGNFAVTLGNGSDNQILQASSDGTKNLMPLTLTLPTTVVPGATVTLTINSPVPIDVWGTQAPQAGNTPLNGTGNTITWTESADPSQAVPAIVFVGATAGSTQINCIWFTITCKDNPPPPVTLIPIPVYFKPTPKKLSSVDLRIISLNDPNGDVPNGLDVTGRTGRKWLVGQRADLRLVVNSPPALDFPISTRWSVSGSVLHQYYDDTLKPTNFDVFPLNPPVPPRLTGTGHPEVSFFWVSTVPGFTAAEMDTARVDVTMLSGAEYSLSTGFDVATPTNAANVVQGAPAIQLDPASKAWELGMLPTATSPDGVGWTAAVIDPIGFAPGQFRFVQMIKPVRSWTDLQGKITRGAHPIWGLDTQDPYDDPIRFNGPSGWWADGNWHHDGDSPDQSINARLESATSNQDTFKTYLMYKPTGDNSGWVPLQRDDWSYGIAVTQINESGKWIGKWTLAGAPWQLVPPFVRETQEPMWTFVHNAASIYP